MSEPEIKYSGPVISPEVPWETRRHLQLLYQKFGNHTQAFQQVSSQIKAIKTGTATTIIEGGGSTPIVPPSSNFLGQGLINDQTGQTSYSTQQGDNGILLILNDASAVAVTLTTAASPFYLFLTNFGAGTVTLTPSTGTINGGASLSLLQNQAVLAACDSTNWETTAVFTPPEDTPAVTHEFLTGYDAATGAFTASQPIEADVVNLVSDLAAKAPLASPTFTGTVTQPDAPVLTAPTTATGATAGTATALPALPAGYLQISLGGTNFKIPYFAV
jgi:hypothetical protein